MRYLVVRQFQVNSEAICAAFNEFDDANQFIQQCLHDDQLNVLKVVYWLFDRKQDSARYTSDNPGKFVSRYVEHIELLPQNIHDPFIVKTLTNQNENILAEFSNINDARKFIAAKLDVHDVNNETSVYYIFDQDKLCEKIDKSTSHSGDKKESHKVFRPTPFQTKPRLGPANYWVDEDEDKKDE